MKLTSNFSHEGWNVKYVLLEPESNAVTSTTDVVFIHGTPWSSKVFVPIAKALLSTGRYRILLYDLPGYGQSQEYSGEVQRSNLFAGDTSVKAQAGALAHLLEHLDLDGRHGRSKPAVIAHDIAGAIALRSHLLHDCQYASLMLWDTNVTLPWGDGFYKLTRAQPEVFLGMPSHIHEAVVRAVVRSGSCDTSRLSTCWENELALPWITQSSSVSDMPLKEHRNFVRQIAQANDADVAEMLDQNLFEQVQCPVKILWGEKDTWIPKAKMDKLANMLKHCLRNFIVIPDAGHLLMIDQPERVTFEVFEWLLQQR